MNVFEDLIVELKEENLLENTVIDAERNENADSATAEFVDEFVDTQELPEIAASEEADADEARSFEIEAKIEVPKKNSGREFFNKHAVDELAGLQMVDHILTGVEREYMKIVPKSFDDFNAKKALHVFVNITEDATPEELKAAESALSHETEAWGIALLDRDKDIEASHIRRYCENSRPALSSQAMVALAKFYRNAPYSELVRAKFDFVITRLFSRSAASDKRVCLFDRNEVVNHINKLYSDWSSVPLYTADSDESNVLLTGLSFEELAAEAEGATHFDQLIERDFFGRLRQFKESISELFFAPIVTASAVESNIRIGNAYVELIVLERRKMDSASIQLKYIEFNEQTVSDAAGQTLDLAEVLNGLTDDDILAYKAAAETAEAAPVPVFEPLSFETSKPETDTEPSTLKEGLSDQVRSINPWILGFCLLTIFACVGLYVWSSYIVEEAVSTIGVTNVELGGTPLIEFLKVGRISGDTFYGVLQPSWDALPKERREEFLKKVLHMGPEKGFKQVQLFSKDGKNAGYASGTRLTVNMP